MQKTSIGRIEKLNSWPRKARLRPKTVFIISLIVVAVGYLFIKYTVKIDRLSMSNPANIHLALHSTVGEPCDESQFLVPDPEPREVANLVERILSHPKNARLNAWNLQAGRDAVFVPNGIESETIAVNENHRADGLYGIAFDYLRGQKRREMMMGCIKEIVYKSS